MDINEQELNGMLKQYGNLGEAHFFYSNTEQLRFDRKHWKWYRVGSDGSFEPLYGVTGVVHIIDKSAPLMAWAKKMTLAKLRRLVIERGGSEDAQFKLWLGDLDQIIAESKVADEEYKDEAADTGHDAHGWIEQYIKSVLKKDDARRDELLAKFPQDERAASCCVAALSWMAAHNVRWISTERCVYSRTHRYAGTCDGEALVDSCDDRNCCPTEFKDHLSVIDWKSSNYLYIEYLFQTAAYQQALEEETGKVFEDRWIIRLGKEDGEFDPWYMPGRTLYQEDWEGYLNCLRLFQSVEKVDERIGGIKGMRRAVQLEIDRKKREAAHRIKCPKADDYKGTRKSKCLPDGTQCKACQEKYEFHRRSKQNEGTSESVRDVPEPSGEIGNEGSRGEA
ncbi:MAG: hypothetical protein C5B59_06610 [Bacteroidetes bacterium]|nr:MAG: hypothetical protein C5B59_06610 [Bacteroidota bacterium]